MQNMISYLLLVVEFISYYMPVILNKSILNVIHASSQSERHREGGLLF